MDNLISFKYLCAFVVSAGGYILYALACRAGRDPREPPDAETKIPLFGHVIGIMQRKFRYYAELR